MTAAERAHAQAVQGAAEHRAETNASPLLAADYHAGRSWSGHEMEDACPCPQEPCGLISSKRTDPTCPQHGPKACKTLRQIHRADECPATLAATAATTAEAVYRENREAETSKVKALGFTLVHLEARYGAGREAALAAGVRAAVRAMEADQ